MRHAHITFYNLVDSGESSNAQRLKHNETILEFDTIPRLNEIIYFEKLEWKVYKIMYGLSEVSKAHDNITIKAERWVYGLDYYKSQK